MNYGPKSNKQLQEGRKRYLSASEVDRGNLYISKATYRDTFMDDSIIVVFDGQELPLRNVDKYGRIFIGLDIMRKYKSNLLELKLISRDRLTCPQ